MPREYPVTWEGGSRAASVPVGRGYLPWERERKKPVSLPVVLGNLRAQTDPEGL